MTLSSLIERLTRAVALLIAPTVQRELNALRDDNTRAVVENHKLLDEISAIRARSAMTEEKS